MNSPRPAGLRSPRLLAIVLILVTGALGFAMGVMADRTVLRRGRPARHESRERVPVWARTPEEHRAHWRHVTGELGLTPAQSAAIDSILDRQAGELKTARADVEPRFREILQSTMDAVNQVLTPEQRDLLEQHRQARRAERRKSR